MSNWLLKHDEGFHTPQASILRPKRIFWMRWHWWMTADKSVWHCRVNMGPNLWGTFPAIYWIYAKKNEGRVAKIDVTTSQQSVNITAIWWPALVEQATQSGWFIHNIPKAFNSEVASFSTHFVCCFVAVYNVATWLNVANPAPHPPLPPPLPSKWVWTIIIMDLHSAFLGTQSLSHQTHYSFPPHSH